MKLKIIILLLTIVIACLGVHFVWYGSITRNCIYTEDTFPVPQQLINSKLIVAKEAYVGIGHANYFPCIQDINNIDREIINPTDIYRIDVGRKYFINRGLEVKSLKKGTSFTLTNIIAITEHGLQINGFSGPIYFLIMKDENNISYYLATTDLGINKEDLFLSLVNPADTSNSSIVKLLGWNSFNEAGHYGDEEPHIEYNGKLTELSINYLKNTVSYWQKLSDRLENGEKFEIEVEIEARTAGFKKIILSDNSKDRSNQVAQIQNEFLEAIPNNIPLTNINKDQYYPYISMQANLKLLNYLEDNRGMLKIKTISELESK